MKRITLFREFRAVESHTGCRLFSINLTGPSRNFYTTTFDCPRGFLLSRLRKGGNWNQRGGE
jgi:hypothetical protein